MGIGSQALVVTHTASCVGLSFPYERENNHGYVSPSCELLAHSASSPPAVDDAYGYSEFYYNTRRIEYPYSECRLSG